LSAFVNSRYNGMSISESDVYVRGLNYLTNYLKYETIDFEEMWSAANCPPLRQYPQYVRSDALPIHMHNEPGVDGQQNIATSPHLQQAAASRWLIAEWLPTMLPQTYKHLTMPVRKDNAITIYTKANCVQCVATKRQFDKTGTPYSEVSLDQYPDLVEKFRQQGYTTAPIVEVETGTTRQTWTGFNLENTLSTIRLSEGKTGNITPSHQPKRMTPVQTDTPAPVTHRRSRRR
ncbi:glutaredoxin domain-containing protein, partial [Arcanobacterium bovis]